MKTNEPAPAANLTVAQLGKALTKSATAPTEKHDEGATAAPATTREPLPGQEAETAEETPPDLSQTANPNPIGDEPAEPDEATPETEVPETPAATILPKELTDAIEIAKGDGKKGVAELLKRVNKVVDQRDTERNGRLTAEERVNQLESELEAARAEKPEASNGHTRTVHPAMAQVSQQLATVDSFIKLLKANPEGVKLDDGELSADEVSDHLESLRDKRTELVARRGVIEENVKAAYQTAHAKVRAEAVKAYPWLAKADAPEQVRMKAFLQSVPGLKELPDHELIVARYFRGKAAEEAAQTRPPVTRRAPPATEPTQVSTEAPGSKAGPADARSKAQREVKEAEEQFKKTGKASDMQKLESAKLRLKRLPS